MPPRPPSLPLVCLLLAATCSLNALAVTAPPPGSLEERVTVLPEVLESTVSTDAPGALPEAFLGFTAAAGGHWWGRLVEGSERASLLSGTGLPLVAGAGNDLPEEGGETLALLEGRVRGLVARHPALLAPEGGELLLSPRRSMILDGGRVATVDFDWRLNGYEVRGARVFARLNSGNLIQVGTRLLGGSPAAAAPALSAAQAVEAMFAHVGGRTEADREFGEPELFYRAVQEGGALVYRLVWEVAFRRAGEVATWTARVDAHGGEVLEFFDANLYGQVTGGVYPRTVTDEEIILPLPLVQLDGGGPISDANGVFGYAGGKVSTGLDGRYFRTNCEDGCSSPAQALAQTDLGAGWLRLGTGGIDELGNGASTKAERNSYYHLSLTRLQAKKWIDIPWFDGTVTTNVNIDSTCNAFYSAGTVNFYRSGGGCNNTGEIADVMQHEWGHGLDGNTRPGDSATGEGTGDHVAFLMHHHSVIGPYFRTSGSGVRDVNSATSSTGLITRSNASSKCPPSSGCAGPLGLECHCEGEIYGQVGWDLAQALVAKHGYNTGWLEYERIFYLSLSQAGTYLPGQADSIYDAYLAVDDDDGNLNNGTPNGQEIFDAFDLHEVAGANVGSSTGCTRPAEPVPFALTDCSGATLSWEAVPGAVEYRVTKNAYGPDRAFLPLATVTGTEYVDGEVSPEVVYYYTVQAVDASGCASTIENVATVSGPQRPVPGLVSVLEDDTPAGNRSGSVDPGEAVDLALTIENASSMPTTGLVGTISTSAPGITVEEPTRAFPDLDGFGSVVNAEGFRFSLDETVVCGSTIDFLLSLTDDSGCTIDTQYFSVEVGLDEARESDTFSSDQGWVFDGASSSAPTGDWTRGVPDPTGYQPGSDSGDAGEECWYTAPNAGGDGSDDVDDGEVVLLSPLFDLSALGEATLSYQRWFGNRDVGEDPDDYFWVEASDDGGSSWVTVEKLGSEVSSPAWTLVEFDLGSIVTLNDQVRFRVRVSDGTLDGNLIEGAFDDFRITEAVCDLTPPCFIPPSFGGLDSALPGPDCAEASLAWSEATSHCANAAITYNIYRSSDAGFTPGDSSLLVGGLDTLGLVDEYLDPGSTYHYLVRAFDSRSGEEGNLLRLPVAAPTTPDTKAPDFTGLASVTSGEGCGEAVLQWAAARETCSTPVVYEVYRSSAGGFDPAPENLVARTTELGLVDAGLQPDTSYEYIVQAVDQEGLSDGNLLRGSAEATVLPLVLTAEDFESGAAGWARTGTNDAASGLWELGDPEGTDAQPGDCPSGTACWATGLSGPGLGDNDVDGGTTTLLSASFSLLGAAEPAIRYLRYYSNDTGSTPGTDSWVVDISNDDGASWTPVENTSQSDAGGVFTEVEFSLSGVLEATGQMRVRFIASDLGDGSLVEAEVDDFRTVDLVAGCDGCGAAPSVGTVLLSLDGEDVLLDWSADPVAAGRYKVYTVTGPAFDRSELLGSSDAKAYRHVGGTLYESLTSYRVSAVDSCGQEGPLQ